METSDGSTSLGPFDALVKHETAHVFLKKIYLIPDLVDGEHLHHSNSQNSSKPFTEKLYSRDCMKMSNAFGILGVFLRFFNLENC